MVLPGQREENAASRHRRSERSRPALAMHKHPAQIALICAPNPVTVKEPPTAPNGGYSRVSQEQE
jgi:hypothetical protein